MDTTVIQIQELKVSQWLPLRPGVPEMVIFSSSTCYFNIVTLDRMKK